MVELAQELSNPELGPALDRLETALTKLRRRAAKHNVTIDFGSPRQGDVLEAIKVLLAEHPANGLRQSEVRRRSACCLPRTARKPILMFGTYLFPPISSYGLT